MGESIASKLARYTNDDGEELEAPVVGLPQGEAGEHVVRVDEGSMSNTSAYTARCTHGVCILIYIALLLGWVAWYPLAVLLPLWSIMLMSNGNQCPLVGLHIHMFGDNGCSPEVEPEHYVVLNMCQLSAIVYAIVMCMGWEP